MATTTEQPPATEKQRDTIARFERSFGIPKAQRTDTEGMTRAQASEVIADYIKQMDRANEPEDDTATQQRIAQAVTQPAPERDSQLEYEARAMDAGAGSQGERGEWPVPPPQSSEAQTVAGPARPAFVKQAQASPFDAPTDDDDLGLRPIGDEDDEIDLERTKLAPVGTSLGFVVISVEKKTGGNYPGLLVTAKHIAGGDEEPGGIATEYLSQSPNARWKTDQFLDACNAPATGKINYRQFVGWRFWASTKRDDYKSTNDNGEERITPKVVIDKYLQSQTPPVVPAEIARSLNGAAHTPTKPVARLGAEFDS